MSEQLKAITEWIDQHTPEAYEAMITLRRYEGMHRRAAALASRERSQPTFPWLEQCDLNVRR